MFLLYNSLYYNNYYKDLNILKNEIINKNMYMDEFTINIIFNYYNKFYGFYIIKMI